MSELLFPMRLSMTVAALSTVLVAVVGTALAYLLARKSFRGRELLDALVALPLVFPPVVTGYYLLLLVGRNGPLGRAGRAVGIDLDIMFSWKAAVLAAFVISLPLMVRSARAAIEGVDEELVNAAFVLGRSELDTALHVVLPLASKGIGAGIALAFARALGEFGATVMLAGNIPGRTNTLPLEIYNRVIYGDGEGVLAIVLLFTAFSVAFVMLSRRLGRVAP